MDKPEDRARLSKAYRAYLQTYTGEISAANAPMKGDIDENDRVRCAMAIAMHDSANKSPPRTGAEVLRRVNEMMG